MVSVGARQPGALAWPQGGQVVPSQVIMGLPQQGGVMRPMGGQQGLMAGGMDEGMMQMGGYGAMPQPMYAAYQPAEYSMPGGVGGGKGRCCGWGGGSSPTGLWRL